MIVLRSGLLAGLLLWTSVSWAGMVIPFSGTLDFDRASTHLVFGKGDLAPVTIYAAQIAPGQAAFRLGVMHLPVQSLDLATVIRGKLNYSGGGSSPLELSGEILSEYILLDYKPVRDLRLKFAFCDRHLDIKDLQLGAVNVRGSIDLAAQKSMHLLIGIAQLDLDDLLTLVSARISMRSLAVSGTLDGEIFLDGSWSRPQIKVHALISSGRFRALDFENMSLDLEGTYPLVRLTEALVTRADGMSMKASGAIDLADLANLGTQVRLLKSELMITETGPRREWIFKRFRDDDSASTDMTLLGLTDDRGDTSAVLGFQKSIGF